MTSRYAEGTTVPPAKSQAEIGAILARYGAASVAFGYEPGRAMVGFVAHGRQVRFTVALPTDLKEFRRTATHRYRDDGQAQNALDAETRRLWRSLGMVIKAKLETVASGIATFESEFLAQIVLPDGVTVGEHALPAVAEAYATGRVPALLPPSRAEIERAP